jgi:hypothetical protein
VRPLQVMFDNNIWSYIGDEGSRPALDKLLDRYGLQLLHAPSVLLEVLRTPKPEVRRRIVLAMVLGRPGRKLRSEADVEAEELVAQIKRFRTEWLRSKPDLREAERFRRFWTRGIWQAVETDLEGFIERAALLPLPERDSAIEEVQAARIAARRPRRSTTSPRLRDATAAAAKKALTAIPSCDSLSWRSGRMSTACALSR